MHIPGLDETDNQILSVIADNARLTYSEIGEKMGLSRVAVKKRMEQMEKSGVIRGYRTEIASGSVSASIPFLLDLEVEPEHMDEVLDRLGKDPAIRQLALLTGSSRIHAQGLLLNRETMKIFANHLYRHQPGVQQMVISSVLCTLKDLDGGIEYEQRLPLADNPRSGRAAERDGGEPT